MTNLLTKTFVKSNVEELDREVNEWSKGRDVKFITPYSATGGVHCKQLLYLLKTTTSEEVKEVKPDWRKCVCGKYVNVNKYTKCICGKEIEK